ncbi:cytochrome c oxidase assembly protein [Halalkalibacterium halodurans]|uniref:cytochrome c oxidase assembly protein n=1 Tax=Halalkalibacterium halodurans TaxID=86665 RepID=UPI002E1EBB69|nr:cytochrome c oxidase assembly protein [Halalkalibacterium halodurans]
MNGNHSTHVHTLGLEEQIVLTIPFVIGLVLYLLSVVHSNRSYSSWPLYRTNLWILGSICALLAVCGPIATRSHTDFTLHMVGHLLLGMLAPLLMVLASPFTLAFRALPVQHARKLAKLLKSRYIQVISDPIVASILNIGGLWILYTTPLYNAMHGHPLLHIVIHLHVFLAGYLFTASMISIDPMPHRTSFTYRGIVLVLALAAHGILSKYIYFSPPASVPLNQAEMGGVLMYYGGDAVDIVLIFVFFMQWYKAVRPRTPFAHESL